ncbi:MAG: dephospho-CoA kinase [Sphingomonadaceae bacterium]|nr:dephospho-CoA kinase [Sphingomonadaceae bacterium]
MITLGLTGSIGMGKSTVAQMFAAEGVPVFDADAEVHRLQGPGGALVEAIEAMFPGTTHAEGVDRALLSKAVLGDRAAIARLEGLVHPQVGESREAFVESHRDAPLVVLDIPLLFEKGGFDEVDAIAVVSAPRDIQRVRVLARPGMTAQKFDHIEALQTPDAEKRRRADFVIATGCPLAETAAQVRALVSCLSAHTVRYCRQCVK